MNFFLERSSWKDLSWRINAFKTVEPHLFQTIKVIGNWFWRWIGKMININLKIWELVRASYIFFKNVDPLFLKKKKKDIDCVIKTIYRALVAFSYDASFYDSLALYLPPKYFLGITCKNILVINEMNHKFGESYLNVSNIANTLCNTLTLSLAKIQ